ncbi:MAG: LTA synthase family protein, partial [Lachnospiraceae bacterium]|nr:LTA synthase family protein [Lachnospiraceae bacterium]
MKEKSFSGKEKAAGVILFCANLIAFLTIWLARQYDQVRLDEILFQLKTTSAGVENTLLGSAIFQVGGFSILMTFIEIFSYRVLYGRSALIRQKIKGMVIHKYAAVRTFLKKNVLRICTVLLAAAVLILGGMVDFFDYVNAAATESDFIQEHYKEPSETVLHFPKQKRNLIYIFLESMENTYADPEAGEPITACYIPELKKLAEDNVNFSHTDRLGGAFSYPGTTWTAAAMAAQTSGVMVKVNLAADTYGAGETFLPGATSIGDILEQEGYNQVLLLGSHAEFHGRKTYFTEHGNYRILDTEALKAEHRLDPDYNVWWGAEDAKILSLAKEELQHLAEQDKPFNFTMLTADTHFPDGYHCEKCEDIYENQYANVLACSSRQISEFVSWIQEQSFYKNTTIVISGDHLTMDGKFMDDIEPGYTRTVYNCFINAAVKPAREKNRQFGTFDMFPTTLAALGVKIEGNRLALGTNLFSSEDTLIERDGLEFVNTELQKSSAWMDEQSNLKEVTADIEYRDYDPETHTITMVLSNVTSEQVDSFHVSMHMYGYLVNGKDYV